MLLIYAFDRKIFEKIKLNCNTTFNSAITMMLYLQKQFKYIKAIKKLQHNVLLLSC